ncbi:MAG: response regulator [Cytophagales bacterium]|nr:response regulator [Cytophagales bacterium]
MRILIVDDSSYIRSMLKTTFEENGYDVIGTAQDGESAIDLALELTPDVITLDNVLPDMTGIDVLKALKEKELISKVIMISAVGQQSTITEGIANGAQDYIVKPFDNAELISIIDKLEQD